MDPLNADSWEILGETEFFMGQLNEAATDIKKALQLNPDVFPGSGLLSQIYVMEGRAQDALAEIERVQDNAERAYLYAVTYSALGRQKQSDAALNELTAKYPSDTYWIAGAYAFRNQSDEAFKWLDQAYSQHNSGLISTKVDPVLKSLHSDPRYAELLKKLNLPN